VLFIPLGEADDHSPIETFNHLWAQQFWGRHHFTRRRDVSRVRRTFLTWYRSQYIAPRQPDTPEHRRLGVRLHTLAPCDAIGLPKRLPICAGRVHAVRRGTVETTQNGQGTVERTCGGGAQAVRASPCRASIERKAFTHRRQQFKTGSNSGSAMALTI
jgi:hypothetical protein